MSDNRHIKEHIERCIELYGQPIDADYGDKIERPAHEQIRADLLIAVGMLMALSPTVPA